MSRQELEIGHSNVNKNFNIPFDILYAIFTYYAEEETPAAPLETLLLVCRFWKETALANRGIWSRFKIEIQSSEDAPRWKKKVDRRLEFSGPDKPIFIQLHQYTNLRMHLYELEACIHQLFSSFAGPLGSRSSRWKEMDLDLENIVFNRSHNYFQYPTPILTSLKLKGVTLEGRQAWSSNRAFPFFPSAPMLQTLVVSGCETIVFPDIGNTTSVEIHHSGSYDLLPGCITDLSSLAKAKQLKHLILDIYSDLPSRNLPQNFPVLISLYLGAGQLPSSIVNVSLPTLRRLSLEFCLPNASTIMNCSGIPFHQLETLEIVLDPLWPHIHPEETENYRATCLKLLETCPNITQLLFNRHSFPMLYNVFHEDSAGTFTLFPNGISMRTVDEVLMIQLTGDRSERERLMEDLQMNMDNLFRVQQT